MSEGKQSTEHHQLATQVIHGGKAPQDPEGALLLRCIKHRHLNLVTLIGEARFAVKNQATSTVVLVILRYAIRNSRRRLEGFQPPPQARPAWERLQPRPWHSCVQVITCWSRTHLWL